MTKYHGPTFKWFAWRPTYTRDRGWRWLRVVHKRSFNWAGESIFETSVIPFED